MKNFCGALIILFAYQLSFAQERPIYLTSALPVIELQQSILFSGAGQIGAAIPMEDPLGFYFNPAQLGYFSRENNFAALFMPQKTKWIGNARDNLSFNTKGVVIGYNFKKYINLPLSIGIGYLHNRFDYGTFTSGGTVVPASSSYASAVTTYDAYDAFDCISLGAGLDYYLNFNIGFSIKPFNSHLGPDISANRVIALSTRGTAYDLGALIIAPVSKLFFDNAKYNLAQNTFIKPKFDITLGYSLTNLGKKVVYVDPAQADPLPRTARLGYTLDFGIDLFQKAVKLSAVDYSFTAEAEDLLLKYDKNFNVEYQGIFGGINPIKHLIKLNHDMEVVVHRGNILRLFETLYITSGRYNGAGYYNIRSNGYGFSSEGIVKFLSSFIDNRGLKYIANHIVIEYYDTNNYIDLFNTNFQGVAFFVKNIEI